MSPSREVIKFDGVVYPVQFLRYRLGGFLAFRWNRSIIYASYDFQYLYDRDYADFTPSPWHWNPLPAMMSAWSDHLAGMVLLPIVPDDK